MIEVTGLVKRYGAVAAVDGLTFTVQPGRVTGFLGPNGAGKSTTLRLILGLDRATAGRALIAGLPLRELARPITRVGVLLDASAVHAGRSARSHLRAIAAAGGIGDRRVDACLELAGLSAVAGRRIRGFSLGMRQRLGIAAALLGDPDVLLFDEPVNGLDAEGVQWARTLMRDLAAQGRTVFVSSHLMAEMQNTADHLVVIGRGRLLADVPIGELIATGLLELRVPEPDTGTVVGLLAEAGGDVAADQSGLVVRGLDADQAGELLRAAGVRVTHLAQRRSSLEEAYLALTGESVDYRAPRAREEARS
ncbi:ABC-2 type transport system ATP-binding protein [Parafrankia irregularis]|uniref:ABC-2 type transport system ATP-binding protein n=1 Tax=Parafrankia irregularis TaxID=795642 RepID=A0A0S4QRX3_9ACTN|nr:MULTISPECIES: ATP-binding cassette domain-containing protein [Parafrankia]MBE3199827.1 ATP-binding cassette domain-containing protein [Parafrankia sp. CH37]CUU57977.1 ABC-2 type transport system ATP-binding protein [Parafrankia irregularis]